MSKRKDFSPKNIPITGRRLWPGLILGILAALFLAVALQRAWLCDDAYITFRTVDNLANGYRLTWNITERVQAYTHPLWMFLLSGFYFFTREIYSTVIFVSLAVSLAAVLLFAFRAARSAVAAALGLLAFSLSNAFIDYSTSGLENPLTHLILAAFFALYFTARPGKGSLLLLSLLAALGGVNRLDTLLIFTPPLLYRLAKTGGARGLPAALVGMLPLALWEAFSLFYYGFPFPNTAYAKLNTGIPTLELARQGGLYLLDSLQRDPLTLVVITGGLAAALYSRRKDQLTAAAGVLLYLLYLIKIGGDFMSGRFLSAPLLCSAALLARLDLPRLKPAVLGGLAAGMIFTGLLAPTPAFLLQPLRDTAPVWNGIADERAFYFADLGLWSPQRLKDGVEHASSKAAEGLQAREKAAGELLVMPKENVGVFGFYAGPGVHIIDFFALADPLLARLPPVYNPQWRIGHWHRIIPPGYAESIALGKSLLADEDLGFYYEKLALVTRGPLFSTQRLVEIWKFNSGQYDHMIDADRYRYPDRVVLRLADLPEAGAAFEEHGVEIILDSPAQDAQIELGLSGLQSLRIQFLKEGRLLASREVQIRGPAGSPAAATVTAPPAAIESGYDQLRILPLEGQPPFRLDYFRLAGP